MPTLSPSAQAVLSPLVTVRVEAPMLRLNTTSLSAAEESMVSMFLSHALNTAAPARHSPIISNVFSYCQKFSMFMLLNVDSNAKFPHENN